MQKLPNHNKPSLHTIKSNFLQEQDLNLGEEVSFKLKKYKHS